MAFMTLFKRKPKQLILDFDGTIVNTNKAILKSLNPLIKESEDKVDINSVVHKWDYSDVVPLHYLRFIDGLFESNMFFDNLELFTNAYETLLDLYSKGVEITIVSVGTPTNIQKKIKWIEKNLPFVNFTPIIRYNEDIKMDKSIINGKNKVILDDNQANLFSINCKHWDKILFKYNNEDTDFNNKWYGLFKNNMISWEDEKSIKLLYKRLGVRL